MRSVPLAGVMRHTRDIVDKIVVGLKTQIVYICCSGTKAKYAHQAKNMSKNVSQTNERSLLGWHVNKNKKRRKQQQQTDKQTTRFLLLCDCTFFIIFMLCSKTNFNTIRIMFLETD